MSVADPCRYYHRPPTSSVQGAAFLGLLLLCALPSESRDVRPSDHGLSFQKNATGAPPAMVAFFRGGGDGVALPQARNATDPIWNVAGRVAPGDGGGASAAAVVDGRDRVRTVLLTVGVVCGAVGVALLAAAAFGYLIQARRAEARRRGAG